MFLATSVAGARGPDSAAAERPAADSQPSPYYDAEAGRRLLEMANRERAKAGLPPLQADEGLTRAARAHAAAMAAQQKLSHQLSGEPSLVHRLAANTKTHLDQTGENVAFAGSVDQAQDSLMHSPPHRANLLNAGYNVAGFSVVRRGSLLYVTQDFGHSLPSRSDAEAEVLVARSVDRVRAQSSPARVSSAWTARKPLPRPAPWRKPIRCAPQGRERAQFCATPLPSRRSLPESAARVIKDAVSSLLSPPAPATPVHDTYPTGVYWVVILFF